MARTSASDGVGLRAQPVDRVAGSPTSHPEGGSAGDDRAPGTGPEGASPTVGRQRSGSDVADAASLAFSQWRAGDDRALDRLVRLLTPMLWHLARAYRVDAAAAEDAVQATWLSLVRSADRIEQPQAVLRWLSVTVQREAARAARASARTQPTEPEQMPEDGPAVDSPERTVLEVTDHAVLWRHVHDLPDRCQRLLRVIAFCDRPDYALLSRDLQMPVGSIGPTRARCLAKLRQSLGADPSWSRS